MSTSVIEWPNKRPSEEQFIFKFARSGSLFSELISMNENYREAYEHFKSVESFHGIGLWKTGRVALSIISMFLIAL